MSALYMYMHINEELRYLSVEVRVRGIFRALTYQCLPLKIAGRIPSSRQEGMGRIAGGSRVRMRVLAKEVA